MFEIKRPSVEATYGGLFGGKPDETKVFLPGVAVYLIDGQEVSEEEFTRRWLLEKQARVERNGQRGDI